jgi:hypothetical protein
MSVGKFIFDNLHYIAIGSTPLVVFTVIKVKQFKPKKNNLTRLVIQYNKQKEAISKKKSTLF